MTFNENREHLGNSSKIGAYLANKSAQSWKATARATLVGMFIGLLGFQAWLIAQDKSPYVDNQPPRLVRYGNYIGIFVDHTRQTYCELKPQRFLWTSDPSIDPYHVPIVYPVPVGNYFIWPHVGRIHLMILIAIPKDLPNGKWYVQSVAYDECHWYSGLINNRLIVSQPLELDLKGQDQSEKNN
jgi:hypothetical protein